MACYSSFDLFQLVKNGEKNSRFLFLASTFTIGFGFWILSFIDMMIKNVYATANYNIPITILSMVVGICFSGMAFYALLDKEKKKRRIYVSAFFLVFLYYQYPSLVFIQSAVQYIIKFRNYLSVFYCYL